jgi:anti-anti-sigma factor
MAIAMQGKRRQEAQLSQEKVGAVTVLRIDGDFTGSLLPRFESDVRSAVLAGSHVVLDMSNTAYIGADALASLIYIMNIARSWKRELWLAGLDRILTQVIDASQLRLFFRMAPKVAEALRRIQPEPIPATQTWNEWAFCRIGGQLVPIHAHEVPGVYRQMRQLLEREPAGRPISALGRNGLERGGLTRTLVSADAS